MLYVKLPGYAEAAFALDDDIGEAASVWVILNLASRGGLVRIPLETYLKLGYGAHSVVLEARHNGRLPHLESTVKPRAKRLLGRLLRALKLAHCESQPTSLRSKAFLGSVEYSI